MVEILSMVGLIAVGGLAMADERNYRPSGGVILNPRKPPPPPTLGIGLPEIDDGTDPVMPEKLSVRFKRFARRLLRRP